MRNKNIVSVSAFVTFLCIGASVFITSCNSDPKHPGYEYMPDMYRSPSFETNSPNPNFEDGMTVRTPVAGTIPMGFKPFPFAGTKEGYEAAGTEWKIDTALKNEANMAEGKRLYEIYCTPCHGGEGNGDGPVVAAGFAPPPSYSKGNSSRGGKMSDLSEGKIYHTITYGLNMMGSHASQLVPAERTKIVMYVRSLMNVAAVVPASAEVDVKKDEKTSLKK